MASEGLSGSGILRGGKSSLVVCGQVSDVMGTSNAAIGDLNVVNCRRATRHVRGDCGASNHRRRVRRPQFDVVGAQRQQAANVSSDFELDPSGMDLLDLADGIFGEFVHAVEMDSRCVHRVARPHAHAWRGSGRGDEHGRTG